MKIGVKIEEDDREEVSEDEKEEEEDQRETVTSHESHFQPQKPPRKGILVSGKYTVERKNTVQHMEAPLDSRKESTKGSTTTLPGSLKRFQRSASHDHDVTRNRVTIRESHDEDVDAKNDTINKYYERNHYTVTGTLQNTYNRLPRNISAHRFQVDKASDACDVASRRSSPGALGEPVVPSQRQFDKSFYWLAMHRKKFGFRYLALCFLAVLYTLFGATVFYLIEGNHEKAILRVRERNLDLLLDHLATVISEAVNDPNKSTEHQRMKDFIKHSYIELQKHEEQYKWSTYYRLENTDNLKWSFSSAFFFSMNVYTTTGYGSISAQTTAGQLFTMCYAFCFVPMTLVILRDLGQLFLVHFTKLYAHGLTVVRRLKGRREVDENEIIQLPIKFCMGILVAYLLFCTTFVYLYDAVMGPEWDDGLPYFTAFYFSFISLSTIGLGDVMPNNVPYAPPVSILFFIGMAVTKVVNRATYIAVENGVFGVMTMAETRIDSLLTKSEPDALSSDSASSTASSEDVADRRRNDLMNTFTVRSIATFMRSNHDVYGGGFGRVQLRRGDLMSNAHTVAGSHGHRYRPGA